MPIKSINDSYEGLRGKKCIFKIDTKLQWTGWRHEDDVCCHDFGAELLRSIGLDAWLVVSLLLESFSQNHWPFFSRRVVSFILKIKLLLLECVRFRACVSLYAAR